MALSNTERGQKLREKRLATGIEEIRIGLDSKTYSDLIELLYNFGFSPNEQSALSRKRFRGEDAFGLVIGYCIRKVSGIEDSELPDGYSDGTDFQPLLELHRLRRCCQKLTESMSKNEVVAFLRNQGEPTPDMIAHPRMPDIETVWTKVLLKRLLSSDYTDMAAGRAKYEKKQMDLAKQEKRLAKLPKNTQWKRKSVTSKKKT